MEEKQKKIEDLNGFKDLRIVDNFIKHLLFSYANNRNRNIKRKWPN